MPTRRRLLQLGSAGALSAAACNAPQKPAGTAAPATGSAATGPITSLPLPPIQSRFKLSIGVGVLDLGGDTAVSTRLYNGQFPGPLLRMREGAPVSVEIENTTAEQEQLHWHGQFLPISADGSSEEGTPFIPPHGRRQIVIHPKPTGFRWYHTHASAGADLSLGLYTGLAGPVLIEPRSDPGAFDQEVFLTLKEFGPYFNRIEMPATFLAPQIRSRALFDLDQVAIKASLARGRQPGWQLGYNYFTINGRMLGHGEPIRVRQGERLKLQVLNASASEIRSLALPGHAFEVVSLDGNPVPRPAKVPVLWLAPGERIGAIVTMTNPGVWVLGDLDNGARQGGMGIVVEYAGAGGSPQWRRSEAYLWDYRQFAQASARAAEPDETIELTIATEYGANDGFDVFTINGQPFSMQRMQPMFHTRLGRRYRLNLKNATDDVHPLHLHRHTFELTSIGGQPTAGLKKDVVMIGQYQEMTIDFTADQPGLSLFHCHMQPHMDAGFMALFDCP